MALKKADLEQHQNEYWRRIHDAQAAELLGSWEEALATALSSLQFVSGMMQYERRYQNAEFESVAAIDLVLRIAPLLFRFDALEELQAFLKTNRQVDKLASDDLEQKVAQARQRMAENHRLYSLLERESQVGQDQLRARLGGARQYWQHLCEAWAKAGVIDRVRNGDTSEISLATRSDQIVAGRCPSCGKTSSMAKSDMLELVACPICQESVNLVLIGPTAVEPEGMAP